MMQTLGGAVGRELAAVQRLPDYAIVANPSIKRKGWEIHASQRSLFRKSYGVPAWLLYSLHDKEFYSVAKMENVQK
jgi:hypothetical protein